MDSVRCDFSFPKDARLRRRADFRVVYEKGRRLSGAYCAMICLRMDGQTRARVGFATPKALGGSVVRNRLKRRLREAVRLSLRGLGPEWAVVLQPRRAALEATFADLKREVGKLFSRCGRL